ncbi:MAG: phosphoribosylanthranilate isomerase [Eggerthellaceae bacterium]|nr:phosphoribosylanthranilate isomerase [Eggerthellaceae bacterium]
MTMIKCCGMFSPEDIEAVNAAHPDFCGFVIDFPKSHRSVTREQARSLSSRLDAGIEPVGVFVDEAPEDVAAIAHDCPLFAVQLHGDEDEAYIAKLRSLTGARIVKAFKIRTPADLKAACASSADFVLLDNGQGTGKPFDWDLLEGFERPYFLAGGLTPETIPQAIARLHPYAVDISSGLETNGKKDPGKMLKAVRGARRD